MWTSLSKLAVLPDETKVYCAHEVRGSRQPEPQMTVRWQGLFNHGQVAGTGRFPRGANVAMCSLTALLNTGDLNVCLNPHKDGLNHQHLLLHFCHTSVSIPTLSLTPLTFICCLIPQYTQSNARFAVTVDPGNEALAKRKAAIDEARAKVWCAVRGLMSGWSVHLSPAIEPNTFVMMLPVPATACFPSNTHPCT